MGVDYSQGRDGTIFGQDGDLIHLYNPGGIVYVTLHLDQLDDIKQFIEGETEHMPRDWMSRE